MPRSAQPVGFYGVSRLPPTHKIVQVALVALLANAAVMFLVFPVITHILGHNYHSDLFADQYDSIAQNLLNGDGYRVYPDTSLTMLRSPGYVLILAGIFMAFGKSLLAVQVVQFLMSAATGVIVYLIARHLRLAEWVSLAAAVIFLFHPITMMAATRSGTDTTLTLCYTGALWLLFRALDSRRLRDFALVGLVLGYAMLVKASVALVFPAIFLFLLLVREYRFTPKALTARFAVIGIVAALVMAPWVIRNYEISGKFVPTMTIGGLAMFQGEETVRNMGNGKDSKDLLDDAGKEQIRIGHEMGLRMREDFFPQFYSANDEITFYRELGHRAWAEYAAQPSLLARAIFHNTWAFWLEGRTAKATLLNASFMVPFLLLAIHGAWTMVRRERKAWILVIAIVVYVLPHLIIISVARYASSLIPVLSILVACSVFSLASRLLVPRKSVAA